MSDDAVSSEIVNPERCEVCGRFAKYQVVDAGESDHYLCEEHLASETVPIVDPETGAVIEAVPDFTLDDCTRANEWLRERGVSLRSGVWFGTNTEGQRLIEEVLAEVKAMREDLAAIKAQEEAFCGGVSFTVKDTVTLPADEPVGKENNLEFDWDGRHWMVNLTWAVHVKEIE